MDELGAAIVAVIFIGLAMLGIVFIAEIPISFTLKETQWTCSQIKIINDRAKCIQYTFKENVK